MKVLMVNGSPQPNGCTYTALCELGNALESCGVEYEIWQLGTETVRDCMADFAAFGRPFLADEIFLRHSAENTDYRSCFRCRECKWLEHYKNALPKNRKTERKNV